MKPSDDTIKPGKEGEEENKGQSNNDLNSPRLDEKTGRPKNKAVSSFKQAHAICKNLFEKAKVPLGRLDTAATIADKYGGSPPFKMADLKKTGQGWRNNFSSNPLGSVVDRSTPQITDPIKQAESLTYSALAPDREDAAEKTRKFRKRVTKLVRSWSGFTPMIGQIVQETYLYGNAAPAWLDDDWRPRAFRYDEVFLPDGAAQHASMAQIVAFRQPVLLHDFIAKLEDKEVAEDAGYDWDGCIKAANESAGVRSDADASPLESVDAVREGGTLGYTYQGETKVVWEYHLLVREYEGGVNLWTTSQKGGHAIRFVENIHENMEDGVTFFTLQEGNTKFYGSKGAGRLLTNIHIALDRGRNLAQDQIYLSGLPILQCDEADMNRVQPTVRHPFILVPKSVAIAKEQVSFDWESFNQMDTKLSEIMEAIAGAFIPPHTTGEGGRSTTTIEAGQKAARELAVKNGVLGRFLGQFADLMGTIQRKVFKPENLKEAYRIHQENLAKQKKGIRVMAAKVFKWLKEAISGYDKTAHQEEESVIADSEAVQCIVDLLKDGLTPQDITELALSPAGNNIEETPEEQDAKTIAFLETKQGNPFYDQKASARMQATLVIGEDRADQVLLPEQEDPNIEAVAVRQQVQEWLAMIDGEMMPVASTDDHKIHRKVILPKLQPIIQAISVAPTVELVEFAKLGVQHYADHVAADMTVHPEAKKPEEDGIQDWARVIESADKKLQDLAAQAQAAGVQGGPNALPPQVNGAPIQATGPGGTLSGTEGDLEREKLTAEAALRIEDQNIEHRKLDIKEKELAAKQEDSATKLSTQITFDTQKMAAEAAQKGIESAQQEAYREAAKEEQPASSI